MSRTCAALAVLSGVLLAIAGMPSVASAATSAFTASAITSPASGAELFYDYDNGSGSVTVKGTVTSPTSTATGDLVCYSPQLVPAVLLSGINVSSGSFALNASTGAAYGEACQLAIVPVLDDGHFLGYNTVGIPSGLSAFAGPVISISYQYPYSANGNLYGYYIESGTLEWSFGLESLGQCPVSSFATDPSSLYFTELFAGGACLPARSGIAPNLQSRSALEVDGQNAYPPGAIAPPPSGSAAPDNDLTSVPGYEPLQFTPTYGPNHATVTITETDLPVVCSAPGTFPPSAASCPELTFSGIVVSQTTTIEPGGQVARVQQQFTNFSGQTHTLDLLFSQSVDAPALGEQPGFEFPGQTSVTAQAEPDSVSQFPAGPGTIVVIGNAEAAPSVFNPVGAITYSQAPLSAHFTTAADATDPNRKLPISTFTMDYVHRLAPGESVTYGWSYSQAATAANLAQLEQVERDRFSQPTISVTYPHRNQVIRHATLEVRGTVTDPVGISSVTVNGHGVRVGADHTYSLSIRLKRGRNQIVATATNVGGSTSQLTETVSYEPLVCVVPRLAGDTIATASAALRRANCTPGKVVAVRSRHVRKGRVIRTTPAAGKRRSQFARVRLYVSRGR
jgi:hypothetical protein